MSRWLVWLDKDLRMHDNPALWHAFQNASSVIIIYILDTTKRGWDLGGASKWWLHHSLKSFSDMCNQKQFTFVLRSGDPEKILPEIAKKIQASDVVWNQRYDPYSHTRDLSIQKKLKVNGVNVITFNGNLLFKPDEIVTKQNSFYKVFKPYYLAALKMLGTPEPLPIPKTKLLEKCEISSENLQGWNLLPQHPNWAIEIADTWIVGEDEAQHKLKDFVKNKLASYSINHNRPDFNGTSLLSPYLAFGEISPRQIAHKIIENDTLNSPFLRQIIWREYCYHLLHHVPNFDTISYSKQFENFPWKADKSHLKAWQKGETGYPLIDAGMRQLWRIGWMHNRVRMVVGSFLTKNLHIHWREGAKWFWDTLLDADLANNSFNWQWVSGSGIDPAPYFRIFNPILQSQKFDPKGKYIAQWVPELKNLPSPWIHKPWEAPKDVLQDAGIKIGIDYPYPIVDLNETRKASLDSYKKLKLKGT